MKIERTKNAISGALWGVCEKFAQIMLPFIVRTILIKRLGAEYLGLSSLFTSVLNVLNLTELGFGSAAVFAMYKPIANDDKEVVGAIVEYLKKVYRAVGGVVLFIGIAMTPFLKYIIKGEVPSDVSLILLFYIYLFNTVISYFLFAYKTSLLSALQLNNVISKVGLAINCIQYLLQIVVLILFKSYYLFVCVLPACTILSNLIKTAIVNKKYSDWTMPGVISSDVRDDIKKKLFPLMSTKLAVVVINSADTLVISAFLGLTEIAIYNNYYYIMNSVLGFLLIVYSAMQAGIGNALVVDSHEKVMADFKKFCFINNWIVTFCAACMLCLYQPFMEWWVGKELMLSFGMVILFTVYFYANAIQRIVVIYKDAAGIWREDMVRCYLSVSLNLLVNILTIRYIGLYGVIGSSVVANIIGLPWMALILYRTVFKENSLSFYATEIRNAFVAAIICFLSYVVCNFEMHGMVGIVLKGVLCVIVSNGLLLLVYGRTNEFKIMCDWLNKSVLKRNIK